MQLRSDWESPECGNRVGITTRSRLASLHFFNATKPTSTELLSFEQVKPNLLEITIVNTFDTTIPEFEVTIHHEGGRGKPQPDYAAEAVPSLKPGESHGFTIKTDLESDEDTLQRHKKRSVILEDISFYVQADTIIFDVVVPFYRLGIKWD